MRKSGGITKASELYYNILIKNNNTGYDTSGNPIVINNSTPLIFNESRSQPYIDRPSDYFMSVISAQIDSQSLPVFIAEPIVGSNDPSDTIYWITITNGNDNTILHQNIKWIPDDKSVPAPDGKAPDNYTSNPWYYCYSYDYFIGLINKTLSDMFIPYTEVVAPFLTFTDGVISLNAEVTNWKSDIKTGLGIFNIYFNTELYYLFSSLDAILVNEPLPSGTPNANYRLLLLQNPSGVNTITVYTDLTAVPLSSGSGAYKAIVSSCNFSPLPFWNPIDSIVFTVGQLTVVPELISANTKYGLGGSGTVSNADQYYILFDYSASLTKDNQYQPNIIYEPIAEYRLADLYGINPIDALTINTFWKDKNGVLHIMTLESGGSAALKIMFRKKVFYDY
jgi:hypothetical protein